VEGKKSEHSFAKPIQTGLSPLSWKSMRNTAASRCRQTQDDRSPAIEPRKKAWLPLMAREYKGCKFTVMFSNTATAHKLAKTDDWVVVYYETGKGEKSVYGGYGITRSTKREACDSWKGRKNVRSTMRDNGSHQVNRYRRSYPDRFVDLRPGCIRIASWRASSYVFLSGGIPGYMRGLEEQQRHENVNTSEESLVLVSENIDGLGKKKVYSLPHD